LKHHLGKGGRHGVVVDSLMVVRPAVVHACSGIILCHNHPSGALRPSNADIAVSKKVAEGAKFLDIELLDHLIITVDGVYSMRENLDY